MRLARVLGAIGRALISAGVIVLLFVAYQLWGTGIQNAAAQDNLADDFVEATGVDVATDTASLIEAARANQQAIEDGQILANEPDIGRTENSDDPVDGSTDAGETSSDDSDVAGASAADLVLANLGEAERQAAVAKLYPEPGEAFARIFIPDINVDQISVEGVSVEDLRKGPGHYRTTPNPGQAGNAAIAGHRTTYGAPFHRVDELRPNDPIFVTTAQGTFEYRVLGFDESGGRGGNLGYFIVSPSDTWVLDQQEGQNLLTLTACHPKYSARQRIIVQAELVGEPAPTIPRDEAVDIGPVTIDSGSTDERAAESDAIDGDIPEEEQVIIGDDVAADDDDTVDADGNPIDEAVDAGGDEAAPDDADDNAATTIGSSEDDTTGTSEAVEADLADVVEVNQNNADLASAQTPFITDDFGEGLNGDPTKVKPAIMWGISGLFIWIAAWFMGRQFERKWTLYAMGLVPFALVLWSTFVNVDQALPSY